MRAVLVLGTIVGFCTLTAGCRTPMPVRSAPPAAALPVAERQIPAPDASAITDLPSLGAADPLPPVGYYRLTAEECRQLACDNSSLANLIVAGAGAPSGRAFSHGASAAVDHVRAFTGRFLAQEARNRAAGAALALYYKILELELQSDVLANSIVELVAMMEINEKLIEKGFKQTAEGFELKKQRIELEADRTRLRSALQKLNAELKSLLAIDSGTPGLLLPADQVRVVPDPLDPEQAVQLGLMRRADLNLLRCLASSVDHRTLQTVRKALVGIAPPLAAVVQASEQLVPTLLPFISAMAKAEVAATRAQLLGLLQDREREAAKEIRTAAEEWTTARALVAIARLRFQLHQDRVDDLVKKSASGQGVEAELRKAKLEWLKAESELIGEIAKWKRADVKARETMGLLCDGECGK